jgi:beta-lactamase regulating signal transducer with metallopeptidase domain
METVNKMTQNNEKSYINQDTDKETIQDNNKLEPINENQTTQEKSKTAYAIHPQDIILYIWIAGVIAFLIREVSVYRSFYKNLKNTSNETQEDYISDALEICKKELNINKKVIVKECSHIKSPMLTGVINPIITIPKMEYNTEKLEIIFNHELIHYKRKDICIKIIALIVNMINWFNPIAYILKNNINIACELSLDEQLVKNMDKSKRKYYGQIILELLEHSQRRSLVIGTALYRNKKELETRLRKIIYFKKSKKAIAWISLIVAMLFTSTSVFASSNITLNTNLTSTEIAVFVSNDGLYISDLKENNPVALDKGEQIRQPLISRDGLNVAYTKNDNLYICNIKTKTIEEISKNVESYDFDSKGDLIYSTKDTGISMYNTNTSKSISIISNEYKYYNINCDSKNKIYANKKYEYTKGDSLYEKALGIISYDLDSKIETVILESKPLTDAELGENPTNAQILTSLGSTPTISQISNDDKYIYIWNKPNSGSTSSDITEFAVYDILDNKFIEFNTDDKNADLENGSGIYALGYKNNISQNPVNSKIVALNQGDGRDMFQNKNLGIVNTENNKFTNLLPENQVSMTPCYSEDGKNILYSSTKMLDYNNKNNLKTWQTEPHYIYEVNTETQKITQITNGKYFDFMPKYLLNNEILFVRADGDSFSLWKTKDGVETKLSDALSFKSEYTNSWYYGHYKTERVIDVFIK